MYEAERNANVLELYAFVGLCGTKCTPPSCQRSCRRPLQCVRLRDKSLRRWCVRYGYIYTTRARGGTRGRKRNKNEHHALSPLYSQGTTRHVSLRSTTEEGILAEGRVISAWACKVARPRYASRRLSASGNALVDRFCF